MALPEGAVQTGRDAPYVWMVKGGGKPGDGKSGGKPGAKVQMRDVVVAGRLGGTVYLASGVEPGQKIVVDALARLRDGDAVRLKGPPGAGRPQMAAGKPAAGAGGTPAPASGSAG